MPTLRCLSLVSLKNGIFMDDDDDHDDDELMTDECHKLIAYDLTHPLSLTCHLPHHAHSFKHLIQRFLCHVNC